MWTAENTRCLLRELRDITDAVERLDHGVCLLEAKQLALLNTPRVRREMRDEANFLTAMNNTTAEWIQSTLKKVEETVRLQMEGAENSKELVEEFIRVLRASIRVLNEYRLVQETYVNELNKRVSISLMDSERKLINITRSAGPGDPILFRLANIFKKICTCS